MRDMKLDEYHDLAIENGDFAVVSGLDEQVQAIRIALLTVQGEVWLNGLRGVPWNDGMFWTSWTQEERELWLRREILSVGGVESVTGLEYSEDRENHAILERVGIQTVEGVIEGV